MPYIGRSTDNFGVRQRYTFTPNAGTTSISGNDVNGLALSFTDGAYVDVYLNGVKLKSGTDYVTTTANTIGSLTATVADDEVEVIVYDVFSLADMVSATNGGTFNDGVTITTADNTNTLKLVSTDADNDVGPVLNFFRNSASPADSDSIGHMEFNGQNDAGEVVRYARIRGRIDDVSDGTEDSKLIFETITAGATQENVRFEPNSIVVNEGSADIDFRVESNGQTHMLFVDGGDDAVILGHSAKVDGINDDNEGVKGSGGHLQIHGATPCLDFFSYSTTNGTHGGINFMKSRNNTVGTATTITSGDVIGSIAFGGFDGVDYASIMGKIDFQAGGAGMAENDTAGEMVFYTTPDGSGGNGSSERLRITSAGNLRTNGTNDIIKTDGFIKCSNAFAFHGSTDNYGNVDGQQFHELNSSQGNEFILMLKNTNAGTTQHGLYFDHASGNTDNNSSSFIQAVNTAARFRVDGDGDVTNHDNSYGGISDERIKQNITDANSQWDDIKAIKIRNFKKKDDVREYGDKAWSQIGVIAQELETISPHLVKDYSPSKNDILSSSEFGTLYTSDDAETKPILYENGDDIPEGSKIGDVKTPASKVVGDIKEEKTTVKGVKYSILYMKAIKALQEAMTRIETLETKVKALEEA